MKKTIKQTGNSLGIYFTKEEAKLHGLKEGSHVIINEPIHFNPQAVQVSFKDKTKINWIDLRKKVQNESR